MCQHTTCSRSECVHSMTPKENPDSSQLQPLKPQTFKGNRGQIRNEGQIVLGASVAGFSILNRQSHVQTSPLGALAEILCEGTLFRGSNKGLKGNRPMLRLPHLETSPEPTCILEAVWNARSRWQRQTRPSCHLPFLFCTGPPNP